jgi:hypothetical protein
MEDSKQWSWTSVGSTLMSEVVVGPLKVGVMMVF